MAAPRPLLDEEGQQSSGSPVHVGQVISGKYRIERQIGRGGMGIVLAATHLQLEHLVAIKVMRRDLVVDDKSLDRLLMEARSAARIRSEHVARVLDVGTLEDGSPFIVMEYLEGENLADLLDREGALQIEQAASFLMQCCLALAEVHVAEMVHRDLKPGNLFIAQLPDGSPTVKIVDFGISKHIGSARDQAATTSPQVLGSPFYMSPEQMRAEPVDERSDLWGLGAILFEMLTGRPPFIGDTLPEVYSAVLNEDPPGLDGLRPGVPGGLDDVVQRCLEKDPAQRFCDVADLAEALAPYAGPTAAQSVERITRILTNPDAVRARYSILPPAAAPVGGTPGGPVHGDAHSMSAGVVGLDSALLSSGERAHGQGAPSEEVEGMMAGDSGGRDAPKRPSRVDAGRAPHGAAAHVPGEPSRGGTWIEPGQPVGEAGDRSSWRPSRPAPSGDFTPLSATGIQAGSLRRRINKSWIAAGVGALALLAAGLLWQRGEPSPPLEAPATPVVEVIELTPSGEPSAQPPPAPPEPRVTPILPESGDGETESATAAQPRPLPVSPPRAKPQPAPANEPGPPRRPSISEPQAVAAPSRPVAEEPMPPAVLKPEPAKPEPPRAPPPPSPALAHGDDPWNPDSFGDRR